MKNSSDFFSNHLKINNSFLAQRLFKQRWRCDSDEPQHLGYIVKQEVTILIMRYRPKCGLPSGKTPGHLKASLFCNAGPEKLPSVYSGNSKGGHFCSWAHGQILRCYFSHEPLQISWYPQISLSCWRRQGPCSQTCPLFCEQYIRDDSAPCILFYHLI